MNNFMLLNLKPRRNRQNLLKTQFTKTGLKKKKNQMYKLPVIIR